MYRGAFFIAISTKLGTTPDLNSYDENSSFQYPSLRELLVSTTIKDEMASFLSRDKTYKYVKAMHRKNLIIPVVGDFSGDKAIRRVSDYVRSHGTSISVFYTSNVEMYLSSANNIQKFDRYFNNVSYLPINESSTYLFKLEYLPSRVLCLTLVAFHWKGWAFSL